MDKLKLHNGLDKDLNDYSDEEVEKEVENSTENFNAGAKSQD